VQQPAKHFKVLTAVEVGKLIAQDTGLTEREATRVFRSVTKTIKELMVSGCGISLGEELYLEPRPVKPRRFRNPTTGEVGVTTGHWTVRTRVSLPFRKRIKDALGPPTPEEIRYFESFRTRMGDKIW
jgi:nucleoid DNA-binding protein